MAWAKGQSGNPKGRPKRAELTESLRSAIRGKVSDADGRTKRKALVETLLRLAIEGDVQAIKVIFERLDGKVPDQLQHSGPEGEPLSVLLLDRLVRDADSDD